MLLGARKVLKCNVLSRAALLPEGSVLLARDAFDDVERKEQGRYRDKKCDKGDRGEPAVG